MLFRICGLSGLVSDLGWISDFIWVLGCNLAIIDQIVGLNFGLSAKMGFWATLSAGEELNWVCVCVHVSGIVSRRGR